MRDNLVLMAAIYLVVAALTGVLIGSISYSRGRNKQRQVHARLERAYGNKEEALKPTCLCGHYWNYHYSTGSQCAIVSCGCKFYMGVDPSTTPYWTAPPPEPKPRPRVDSPLIKTAADSSRG